MYSLLDHKNNLHLLSAFRGIVPVFSTERKTNFATEEVFCLRLIPINHEDVQVDVSPLFFDSQLYNVMTWIQGRLHLGEQINIPSFVNASPSYVFKVD